MKKIVAESKDKGGFFLTRKTKQTLFYYLLVALPLLQFLIFYVYVNINNILLAFQSFDRENLDGGAFIIHTNWTFKNFSSVIKNFADKKFLIGNSLLMFAVAVLIEYPLALIFSYYIYKKLFFSKLFKFVLFMPQIVSGLVFGLLFNYIVTDVYLAIVPNAIEGGLLGHTNMKAGMATIIFFNVWISFGVNVLLFSGAMSGINNGIVESAQIDGVDVFREFIYITIPMIFGTITSLFVISLAGIFTNQMGLLTLFGSSAHGYSSLGYYMYLQALGSDIISPDKDKFLSYSELAALGVLITLVTIPVILCIKKLMNKFGPSED